MMRKIKYNEEDGVIGFSKMIKQNSRDNNVEVCVDKHGVVWVVTVIAFIPDPHGKIKGNLTKINGTGQFDGSQIRPKVLMKDSKGYFYRKDSTRISLTDKSVKKMKKRIRQLKRSV